MVNNHQHFEEWLFSEEDLSPEDSHSLEEHLHTCSACCQLSLAWREVERDIQEASELSPTAGFTDRWQVRLASEKRKQQRRQNLSILLFTVGVASLLLVASSVMVLPLLKSPWPFLLTWAYQLMTLLSITTIYGGALTTLLRAVVGIMPPLIWATLPVAIGLLSLIWLLVFQKIFVTRRIIL